MFEYFEVAHRRGVEVHPVAEGARFDGDDVRQRPERGGRGVTQKGPRRGDGGFLAIQAEAAQVGHAEMVLQERRALLRREVDGLAVRQRRVGLRQAFRQRRAFFGQHFRRPPRRDERHRGRGVQSGPDLERAAGQLEAGRRPPVALERYRGDVPRLRTGQQLVFVNRPPRDDADDLAPHQLLGLGRVLGLVGDRDLVAGVQQFGDVAGGGVVGEAAHRHAVLALAAAGERQAQQGARGFGVAVEHLVEISQAEKYYRVRVAFFDGVVLPEHRRRHSFQSSPRT